MPQIQRNKSAILTVSLPKDLRKQVVKYAKDNDMTASQLVKESLKGYIFTEDWKQLRQTFKPLAKKLKIKSDEDVERIFG